MITLIVIESAVLKAFKMPLKSIKKAKRYSAGFRTTDARYLIYYIALQYQIEPNELAKRYNKHRTNIYYGEMTATDLLCYDKQYQAKYNSIKRHLDNLIINSYEN